MSSELSHSFSSLTMADEQSEANLKPCCTTQKPKTEKQEQEQQKVSFTFPPGYRFCPRDDELIVHYLKKKVMNEPLPYDNIVEVNLSQYSPQQLSETYAMVGENEWYFFTPRDRKYRNGTRPNRAAGIGYWKATGADKPIKHKSVTVGFRKALVFYEGKPQKGEKTNWIMHEYRVNGSCVARKDENDMRLDNWVLCRIYQKMDKSLKSAQRELNSPLIKNYHVGKNRDYEETNDSIGSVSAHKDNIHHTSVDSSVTLVDSYIEGFSKLPADDPYPFHDETKPTYFHMAQPSSTWINCVPDYMNDVQWDASGYQENCYSLLPLEYLNVNPPDSFLDM